MTTELVLDTLEHAIWTRRRDGVSDLSGLVHHTDAGSQYTSFAFTQRLIEAGVDASVGSVGDAYDNALAESQIGLYKTELIRPEGPWRDVEHVELETLDWVDWFNTRAAPRVDRRPDTDPGRGSPLRCTATSKSPARRATSWRLRAASSISSSRPTHSSKNPLTSARPPNSAGQGNS